MKTSNSDDTYGIDPHEPATRGSTAYLALVCLVATLGGLLFGYDTAVIAGAIGFLKQHFALTSALEGWAASCALAGCMLGAAFAGSMSDFLGRKKVLVACAVLFIISAIGSAIPRTVPVYVIFRFLGGIGVGAASMTSPMYIAEISPARIRGRMVSLNQLAIVFGMLVVYFVNYFIASAGNELWNVQTGWRWMFASEAIPALGLLLLLVFVPESPRWLVQHSRSDEALAILTRVNGPRQAGIEVGSIQEAIKLEGESLRPLFRGGMRVALTVGIGLAVLQQVTGINVFLYYAPKIFMSISGAESDAAMMQTVVIGAVNMLFTVFAIWTVDRIGRKPLMLVGFAGMGASLFALGLAAYSERTDTWVLAFILSYIACFALSVGPVTWVILSEIFPTRIRGRAMAVATVCLWGANLVVSQTFPMLDENAWLVDTFHHAFPFWMYGSLCLVAIGFLLWCVPETKGRTLEQIERHWLNSRDP